MPGVTNLSVANVSTTAVHLSWLSPESPDDPQPHYEYKIQATSTSGTTIFNKTQSNSTIAIVTGLQPGTGYYFNVTVVEAECESPAEQELGYTSEFE